MNSDGIELKNSKWLPIEEACRLMNLKEKTLKDKCRNGEFIYKITQYKKKVFYYIKLDSLPEKYINKYFYGINHTDLCYSEAPDWAKKQAEKYIQILSETEDLKGRQLEEYIACWNAENEEYKTSYPSIIRMRRRYEEYGINGLLSQRGNIKRTTVSDEYFDYFKNLYFKEGAPSLRTCRDLTMGYAMRTDGINKEEFPSHMAFRRRLDKDIPKQRVFILQEKGRVLGIANTAITSTEIIQILPAEKYGYLTTHRLILPA